MILYYLIAGGFSVCMILIGYAGIGLATNVIDLNKEIASLTRRLNKQGEALLEFQSDLLVHKDTVRILKKNLFKCLDVNSTHYAPAKTDTNQQSKRKRGRPKKHS